MQRIVGLFVCVVDHTPIECVATQESLNQPCAVDITSLETPGLQGNLWLVRAIDCNLNCPTTPTINFPGRGGGGGGGLHVPSEVKSTVQEIAEVLQWRKTTNSATLFV